MSAFLVNECIIYLMKVKRLILIEPCLHGRPSSFLSLSGVDCNVVDYNAFDGYAELGFDSGE